MSSSTPRTVKLQRKKPVKKIKLQPKSEGSEASSSGKTVKLQKKKPVRTVKLVRKTPKDPGTEGQESKGKGENMADSAGEGGREESPRLV
jgi:hypothetical protein